MLYSRVIAPRRCTRCTPKGFTLVEVMVVVAIVGIVAALAYPSYQAYIQRARRVEARIGLLQAAQWLERVATASGRYPEAEEFPSSMQAVPSSAYTIEYLPDLPSMAYTLTARPIGAQRSDPCGCLTLTHHGLRGVSVPTQTVEACWNR